MGDDHQLGQRGHAATLSAVLAQSNAHSVPPRNGRVVATGFPVAGDDPVVGLGRPLGNVDHVRDPVLARAFGTGLFKLAWYALAPAQAGVVSDPEQFVTVPQC
jgi:hypothetical protein